MAWRIHDSVRRGEIDNRQRGLVQGRLWLDGYDQPLVLELQGNACQDLAGCLLMFENPGQTQPLRPEECLHQEQRGTIGDLTASRKVRVFDIPFEEACERLERKEPVPEHLANCLYLEWFSEANGRVVIESTEYRLTISAPDWTLSPAEEANRARDAAAGFTGFMTKLSEAIEASARQHRGPGQEWDEFDYEHFMRECDQRTDKYMELLDNYRDHPDREAIIAREMGWERIPGADAGDESFEVEAMNRIGEEAGSNDSKPEPDPATEGRDWVRNERGVVCHPLQLRVSDSAFALWSECKGLEGETAQDPDLQEWIEEYQITATRLAGALKSLAYGRRSRDGAFISAYLERALGHLQAAQAAMERVASRQLLPAVRIGTHRQEMIEIGAEILRLVNEFRGKSK